ncbi:hypothetical protein P5V15_004527, partial [Pogonomyrmex californicus]
MRDFPGGLFHPSDDKQEVAFRYAAEKINANRDILPKSRLSAQVEVIQPQDSFHASKRGFVRPRGDEPLRSTNRKSEWLFGRFRLASFYDTTKKHTANTVSLFASYLCHCGMAARLLVIQLYESAWLFRNFRVIQPHRETPVRNGVNEDARIRLCTLLRRASLKKVHRTIAVNSNTAVSPETVVELASYALRDNLCKDP